MHSIQSGATRSACNIDQEYHNRLFLFHVWRGAIRRQILVMLFSTMFLLFAVPFLMRFLSFRWCSIIIRADSVSLVYLRWSRTFLGFRGTVCFRAAGTGFGTVFCARWLACISFIPWRHLYEFTEEKSARGCGDQGGGGKEWWKGMWWVVGKIKRVAIAFQREIGWSPQSRAPLNLHNGPLGGVRQL